jgi:predicted solute-binding protein
MLQIMNAIIADQGINMTPLIKKASKSFDLEALKLAAPGIVTSNQIMQDWADLGSV